jgi:MoaA/NifB/PqqE/SkfB family radical SAM enzyme
MVSKNCKDFNQPIDIINNYEYDTLLVFGGEPLLRKDICDQLVNLAKSQGKSIVVPTNGILLTDEIIEEYGNILISSNGTEETCKLTGQPFIPKLATLNHKEKCCIGMRVIPQTAHRMYDDFMYFWNAGYRRFNITPIIEMDWDNTQLQVYKECVIKISQVIEYRKQIWNWVQGGICGPYRGTICLDQEGKMYACARYFDEKIELPEIPDKAFKKCLNCDKRDYCFHNCNFINYIKLGSPTTPYYLVCKFAEIYKDVFGTLK